ncbi:hypothetical protein EI555_016584, partial [Monodon monoceros]
CCPALISLWPAISLSPNTTPSIKLQSSGEEIFEVDVEIAKQSVTIKTILEDLGMDDEGDDDRLILVANYLDIKGLLDVTCKTVANMIKGKTPEEIRKTFNIKNDFTEEEEAQVRKEN